MNCEHKLLLWIIIPCYNEEKVLPITGPLFLEKLTSFISKGQISNESRVLFVDDGSIDKTWNIINKFAADNKYYIGIRQSRNRGHQNALLAGLMEAKGKCDITISIDCDGQDDIDAMDQMLKEYLNGVEVVYGVRRKREKDTWFKRTTAESFYRLMNVMGVETIFNHADYRLISNLVLQHLADFEEVNIFLRGLVPLVGFKSSTIFYDRAERLAGRSHYTIRKMLGLAVDGITSLSIKPIIIITGIGIVFSLLGLGLMIWAIIGWFLGNTVVGWASLFCVVCILGGIQLISLGIIGQYVGKTYLESKRRPRFIISERTWIENKRI